jgi:hypothetical protein
MTALLVSVFAFFGAHTLLWLQRIAIGRVRGRSSRDGGDHDDHGGSGGGVAAAESLPSTAGESAPSRAGGDES